MIPITFEAVVWLYSGAAAWHFVSLPEDIAHDVQESFRELTRGWGSLPVQVHIGSTSWKTSIFPDKKRKTYLLPLKAEIRKKEHIKEGDTVLCTLEILPHM